MKPQKSIKYFLILFTFIISLIILNIIKSYSASITYIPEEKEYQANDNKSTNIVNAPKKLKHLKHSKNKIKNNINNDENNLNNTQTQNSKLKTEYLTNNQNITNQNITENSNNYIITNRKYHYLTFNIKDLNKEMILSKTKIKTQNKEIQFNINGYFKTQLEEDYLIINISPINKKYQELIIKGNLTKDTNLEITLMPKKFDINFNITDIYSNKINDITYKLLANSLDLTKLIKKEGNKLYLNLIENNSPKIIELNDLSDYTENTNLIPNNFELSIFPKGYKNEILKFKINPKTLNLENYSKAIILEKKFYLEHILPYIYLSLFIFLSLIPILAIYYRDKKANKILIKENKVENVRKLKDTIVKAEQNTYNTNTSLINSENPKVSDYILLEKLGVGGTAVVYKAINTKTKNVVALKLIHKHLLNENVIKERIENEIEINKLLSHPNIVKLLDYNLDDNPPYIAFEYIEGKSLDKILKEKKKLNIYETIGIWIQTLEALDYAHQKGIVHRDLKPENILIKLKNNNSLENSIVKITDFGISKIIDKTLNITQDFVGTPWYMSPEQIKGQKVDQRSDIYSLGIIIFQLLTGKLPFGDNDNIYAIFKAHMLDNPIDSHILEGNTAYIPPDIEKIIRKMLEKNPKKRYQMVSEIINDLKPHFIKYSTTKASL
jgi:tRNA A-37 threonylcarbamoyl transferase component Bud32